MRLCLERGHSPVVLDLLTYAGSEANLPPEAGFYRGDICDSGLLRWIFEKERPDAVFNFAAESHVCRSIRDGEAFMRSNVQGTYVLLRESLSYWQASGREGEFRYVQISTDEVFGDLSPDEPPFCERSLLRPHSPYAASKAAADHLVDAFSHTFGLPTIITRCSNNYGSRQYPEKLIPFAVSSFLAGSPFALHGDGSNVRDWIAVEDHVRGVLAAYERGRIGESYCFGGASERDNLTVVHTIKRQLGCGEITFGPDRPGNDRRYAIDFSKATRELNWRPEVTFEEGLRRTVSWYCENPEWIKLMLGKQ